MAANHLWTVPTGRPVSPERLSTLRRRVIFKALLRTHERFKQLGSRTYRMADSALLIDGVRRAWGQSVGGGESFTDHVQVASAICSVLYAQSPGHHSGCTIAKLSAMSPKFFVTPVTQPLLSILGHLATGSGGVMPSASGGEQPTCRGIIRRASKSQALTP